MNKGLNTIIYLVIALLSISCSQNNDKNKSSNSDFYVANWNVENLFDTIDDPLKNDEWFSPESEINWTERKLNNKMVNLARVINYMNSKNGPDILGLQEIENIEVLQELVKHLNPKNNYKIVHFESPDNRGIDNGLIYNSNLFSLNSSSAIDVMLGNGKNTRDIVYAELEYKNNIFHIFVNHWPSRREGLKKSEPNRIKAAQVLFTKIKEIPHDNSNNTIIIGDFNDLPSNLSIGKYLGAKKFICKSTNIGSSDLLNLAYEEFEKGNGTYKYKDHWNMLDQIIVSNSFFNNKGFEYVCGSFEIIKPEFVIQKNGKYAGTSLPTYGGRKYLGGYSDHFAIGAKFVLKNNLNK